MKAMAKSRALRGVQEWIAELGGIYSLPRGPVGFQLRSALRHLEDMESQISGHPNREDIQTDIAAYKRSLTS